ncbi:hypothetical protein RI054_16g76150 [Pseudoscourfieldia marina]
MPKLVGANLQLYGVLRFRIGANDLYYVELEGSDGSLQAPAEARMTGKNIAFVVTCTSPITYKVKAYLEQKVSQRHRYVPQVVWTTQIGAGFDKRHPAYIKGMPYVQFQRLLRVPERVRCDKPVEKLFPADLNWWQGSWVRLKKRVRLARSTCCAWDSPGAICAVDKKAAGSAYNKKYMWRPYGLPRLHRFYGIDMEEEVKQAMRDGPHRSILFVGDSIMRRTADVFLLMTGGMKQFCKEHGSGPQKSRNWEMRVHDVRVRFNAYTAISIQTQKGAAELARNMIENDNSELPGVFVLNAGLWDIQARPPRQVAPYIKELILELDKVLGNTRLKVFLLAAPVSTKNQLVFTGAKDGKAYGYRTNSALLEYNKLVESELVGTDWHVIDLYNVLNAVRFAALDYRHYNCEYNLDVANIIFNVVYSNLTLLRKKGV